MKAAADSPKAAVQVFLDKGTAKERKLGKRLFTPGSAEYFWISAMGGNAWHTLDVEWIEGTFKLDYAKLAGSWCLGNRVYAYTNDNANQYKGNSKPYPLEWNSPCQSLTGGLEANSATYTDALACTLSFDLDEEFARLGYIYTASTGQSLNAAKTHSVVYVNGVEFGKYTNLWQFGDIGGDWIKFPAGTFKPGRNTLAIRYDTDYHASGYWVVVRGHVMLPTEASLPEPHRYLPGGIVILR